VTFALAGVCRKSLITLIFARSPALLRMATFPPVDTKDPNAVAAFIAGKFSAMYPHARMAWISTVLRDVDTLFSGRHPDYAANDVRYHDFEHTLQAAVCITELLEGRLLARVEPEISARMFELGMAGVLLHDVGYLKLRSDTTGTGAKYTYCHVLRSCAFAASYLPAVGASEQEVEAVLGAINCTGPTKKIGALHFREPVERQIGCALATADYLGQMAAADYPDELEILFHEFKESDDYIGLPAAKRMFQSPAELVARTPGFWKHVVKPKLEGDFQAMYRFLARPYPAGANPYIEAVERNIAIIQARANRAAGTSAAAAQ